MDSNLNFFRLRLVTITLVLCLWLCLSRVLAAPSAFPETAAFFGVGYHHSLVPLAGLEIILPVPYLDVSAGIEGSLDTSGDYGIRLFGTALVFSAIGTTPPLALGIGADTGISSSEFAIHAGPVLGQDFLFTSGLPMTLSIYLAPGYSSSIGFSFAWAGQVRYYFDSFALELASTERAYLSIAVRYFF